MITLKDVHEMLAEVCEPIWESIDALVVQIKKEKERQGIVEPTGIGWLDSMIADHGRNGRN